MPDSLRFFHHIRSSHGMATLHKIRHMEATTKKLCKTKEHLTFLHRCLYMKLIPKCLRVKPLVNSYKGKLIAMNSEKQFLHAAISQQHSRLYSLGIYFDNLNSIISGLLCSEILLRFYDHLERVKISTLTKTRLLLKKKFNILLGKKDSLDIEKSSVINLSSRTLTEADVNVLSKGLNFSPVPKTIQPTAFIAPIEEAIHDLPEKEADNIRCEISQTLRYFKGHTDNLSVNERKAIKSLRDDVSIIILPADKGNASVILNKSDYDTKMKTLLNDCKTYQKLSSDPTSSTQTRMNSILLNLKKSKRLDDITYYHLRCSSGIIPRIYGLPKIHKVDIPLRPIVSYYSSPTYNLAKHISKILDPYSYNAFSIKTSCEFISKIKDLTLMPDDVMVSFDVVSLFTCVPTDVASASIRVLLLNDLTLEKRTSLTVDDILGLLNLCLTSTSFMYNNQIYKQLFGTAMGSPVSPVIANILMSSIETFALENFKPPPSLWCRYVDDTFCIIKSDQKVNFLNFLNSINQHIKFTMEDEKNFQLPFLDVMVLRKHRHLTTTVFRKTTHTNKYLNFSSCHPTCQKATVVKTLFKRAHINSTSEFDKIQEEHYLSQTLQNNNYPNTFIQHYKSQAPSRINKIRPSKFVCIPYVGDVSEKIKRILRCHNIGTSLRPEKTLRGILSHPKDPISVTDRSHVVYSLPCQDCNLRYIGQTSKQLKERVKEHKKSIKNWDNLSAVADHVHSLDHNISWKNVEVLHENKSLKQRLFLEAYEFNKFPTFKKNRTTKLPETYLNLTTKH